MTATLPPSSSPKRSFASPQCLTQGPPPQSLKNNTFVNRKTIARRCSVHGKQQILTITRRNIYLKYLKTLLEDFVLLITNPRASDIKWKTSWFWRMFVFRLSPHCYVIGEAFGGDMASRRRPTPILDYPGSGWILWDGRGSSAGAQHSNSGCEAILVAAPDGDANR